MRDERPDDEAASVMPSHLLIPRFGMEVDVRAEPYTL